MKRPVVLGKKKLSEAGIFITINTLAATNLENKCKFNKVGQNTIVLTW